MSTSRQHLLPSAARPAGQPLWGAPKQRQPIVPLIAMALITLLVAAPAAMSGAGESSNPVVLMHNIAASTYTITGLLNDSNHMLSRIDSNVKPIKILNANMVQIATATGGMKDKTQQLNEKLGKVGVAVSDSRGKLGTVDTKLVDTAKGIGDIKTAVNGSLGSTKSVVSQFGAIGTSINAMDINLRKVIALMAKSTPLTKSFAENKTRIAVAGGDSAKFKLPNIVAGNRVMSIVLPMINTMQNGGVLVAKKESAKASNPLVGFLLNRQVPDGTNVGAIIKPYDGFYGLPGSAFFVNNRIHGF